MAVRVSIIIMLIHTAMCDARLKIVNRNIRDEKGRHGLFRLTCNGVIGHVQMIKTALGDNSHDAFGVEVAYHETLY